MFTFTDTQVGFPQFKLIKLSSPGADQGLDLRLPYDGRHAVFQLTLYRP